MSELVLSEDPSERRRLHAAAKTMTDALSKFVRDGAGPVTGAREYAEARLAQFGDPDAAIRRIVNESMAAAGTTGFVTGLGGFLTMPVTIPANLAGTAMINARMAAAVSQLRGWDAQDPAVQHLVLLIVAGESANSALRTVGVAVGKKLTQQAIERVPAQLVRTINSKVGFMLLAKYGTKRSFVTLSKLVPVVGGVVGGTVDAGFSRAVGSAAKKVFPAV